MLQSPHDQSSDSSGSSSSTLRTFLSDSHFVDEIFDRIKHGETTRELSRLAHSVLQRHQDTLPPLELWQSHSIDVHRLLLAMLDSFKLSGGTRYVASAIIIADQRGRSNGTAGSHDYLQALAGDWVNFLLWPCMSVKRAYRYPEDPESDLSTPTRLEMSQIVTDTISPEAPTSLCKQVSHVCAVLFHGADFSE